MVLRLARYLRVLRKLKSLGFLKVFSNNLGDAIGVTPAVVRKDFSVIGIPGNKRGGYNIDTLLEELVKILGKNGTEEVIVVGCGRIGTALMTYREFQREGIRIVAGFDSEQEKVDPHAPVPVFHISDLSEFVRERGIQVGVIAAPDQVATQIFELMVDAGIRGVLNFTSVELKCPSGCHDEECAEECTVHNVNIGLEIENLFYMIRMKQIEPEAALEDSE